MPEIQEYKGNKILNLNPESKFTFSFGLAKAKLILENLDVIKKFVESEGKDIGDAGSSESKEDQQI
ncbi:MAG TPA: hypothetical protein PK294_03145 [Ignavibacteria bacterium]|nr:hypothetical protein [Ignavibacteria bacterium]HRA99413.1 hypothetical protein [Ignavibacteria bacterium]